MTDAFGGAPGEPPGKSSGEPDAVWRFALAVYGRPGVAAVCLDQQDRAGRDVCLLLFALWAGAACGTTLTPGQLAGLRAVASAWSGGIVGPLRTVRRRLKHGPAPAPNAASEALRARIQASETEAERLLLTALAGTVPLAPAPHRDEAAALANLGALGVTGDAAGLLVEAALAACNEPPAVPGG